MTALGLAYMRPTPEERDEINRIIMEELVCGVFKAEAVAYYGHSFDVADIRYGPDGLNQSMPRLDIIDRDGSSIIRGLVNRI